MASLRRPRRRPPRTPRGRPAAGPVVAGVGLALLLAACGSQLDPSDMVNAGSGTGVEGGGTVPGADPGTQADGSAPSASGGSGGGQIGSTDTGSTSTGSGSGSESDGGTEGGTAPTGGGGDEATEDNAPTGDTEAASCDGFDGDQPGMSGDKITIANVSDISGPVPGIFESAQQGTRADAAFFNATSDICGRDLEVLLLDSRADAGADQQAYARACDESFAAVGSQSAFDAGGAATAEACGIPDIRAYSLSTDRTNSATCYAAYAVQPGLVPNAMPQYWVEGEPDAVKSVGMICIYAGAAPENAEAFRSAWETNGWNIEVFQGMGVSEFNYAPYVQQMKDATIHDANYVEQAGDLGNGAYVYSQTALFDDYSIPERKLYRSWLEQVDPGAVPNTYGLYAWSATRLFVEQAVGLGGELNRKSLLQAMTTVKNWTSNGVHVPQNIAAKTTANCASIISLNDGKWTQVSPGDYLCGSMTNTRS